MASKKPNSGKRMGNMFRLGLFWALLVVSTLTVIALTTPQENLKEVSLKSVTELSLIHI